MIPFLSGIGIHWLSGLLGITCKSGSLGPSHLWLGGSARYAGLAEVRCISGWPGPSVPFVWWGSLSSEEVGSPVSGSMGSPDALIC